MGYLHIFSQLKLCVWHRIVTIFQRMASGEQLVFDPATGKLAYVQSRNAVPTLEEYMQDPEKYPNYVATMNYENGKMEIMTKAAAQRQEDCQVITKMAVDGFFQPRNANHGRGTGMNETPLFLNVPPKTWTLQNMM